MNIRHLPATTIRWTITPLVGLLLLTGCDKPMSLGDVDSIITTGDPALWEAISDAAFDILEPPVRAARNERPFQVTYQNPYEEDWQMLRRFRQILLLGSKEDPWVAEALLGALEPPEDLDPPMVLQLRDVWAKNQLVTVALLSTPGNAEETLSLLPEIHEIMDRQFRDYVGARMYVSGADTALADTLMAEGGFTLNLPTVYQWSRMDSVFRFRNDNPNAESELIREIVVTWRDDIPEEVSIEYLTDWRTETVERYYSRAQVVNLESQEWRRFRIGPDTVYQLQAAWQNPPEVAFPSGGPFFTRATFCRDQGRIYYLDAWLYAPGTDKYEYMIQLETILNSFRCGAG